MHRRLFAKATIDSTWYETTGTGNVAEGGVMYLGQIKEAIYQKVRSQLKEVASVRFEQNGPRYAGIFGRMHE